MFELLPSFRGLSGGSVAVLALVLALVAGGCGRQSEEPVGVEQAVVLVQPFKVIGQEEGADYLGRVFAESLAIDLEQAEGLIVLPVLAEAGTGETGEDLHDAVERATHVVSGVFTREVETFSVRLEIRDPSEDTMLWQSEVPSGGENLSSTASRLARQTAHVLGVTFPDLYDYVPNLTGGPAMQGSEVMTRALDSWRRRDTAGLLEATNELVRRFPDDAAAQALNAWALLVSWTANPTEDLLVALKDRLAELNRVDPASPYDELFLGYVFRSSGDPQKARVLYSRVLARTDLFSITRAWTLRQRVYTYLQAGNAVAAVDDAGHAVRLDPSSGASLLALSKSLEAAGRQYEAIEASKQGLKLEPYRWRHHQRLGIAYSRAGRFPEATVALDRACELGQNQEACANYAVVLQQGQEAAKALEAAEHARTLNETAWGRYNLACYWSLAGNRSRALSSLRDALAIGFADALIKTDVDLDALRGDPEFDSILEDVEERIRAQRQLSESVFPWQA